MAASTGPIILPPTSALDEENGIRRILAFGLIVEFTLYVLLITYLLVVTDSKPGLSTTASNLVMIILTAQIALMTLTFNYYFGSSSGSTKKDATIAGMKTVP